MALRPRLTTGLPRISYLESYPVTECTHRDRRAISLGPFRLGTPGRTKAGRYAAGENSGKADRNGCGETCVVGWRELYGSEPAMIALRELMPWSICTATFSRA